MKALVLKEIGKLNICEVDKPDPAAGEVIVKVAATGICGSDIPRAYRDGAHNMPLIIGHEFSGTVESAGEGVSDKWIGKRVGIFPLIPCGKCHPCSTGSFEMCKNYSYLGSRRDGGFAEYVAVPEWNLIEIPDEVSFEAAAMLEPMAVAVHAMRRTLDLDNMETVPRYGTVSQNRPPVTIVVCGLGTIGTLLVMFLLDAGYENILVIGNKKFQKETMERLGVSPGRYCDSKKDAAYDFIMDRTGGAGADVFFECVGSNETVSLALKSAAAAGSICYVGNPHSDMMLKKDDYWKILRNQIRITGTWNSSFAGNDGADDDWHYVLDRLSKGGISPEKLITHRYPLDDIIRGFELMRDKSEDYIKVMYTSGV